MVDWHVRYDGFDCVLLAHSEHNICDGYDCGLLACYIYIYIYIYIGFDCVLLH